MENSREFTLLYTHNCTTVYEFYPPSYKQLPAGITNSSISITFKGKKIPQMCIIKFTISSLTTNSYVITNPILYISGSKSIDRASLIAPMRLKVSSSPSQSTDVGANILTSETEATKPIFYELKELTIRANTASFKCSVSEPGTIYFAVMEMGTNRNKVNQS